MATRLTLASSSCRRGGPILCDLHFLPRPVHRPDSGASRTRCMSIRAAITKDRYNPKMCFGCRVKNELSIDVAPPRGTRDFPPDLMRERNWLFSHFHAVSSLFGFEQVDFPVVEAEALYKRKAGEEITEQLYSFEDKSGRRLALRPELTPSLVRLIIQKGYDTLYDYRISHPGDMTAWRKSLAFPAKWYTIGQCWRYERMTKGRRREHYQWNMDVFGVAGVEAEAELLAAVVTLFQRLGLGKEDIWIRVSNRKIVQAILDRYAVSQDKFAPVCVVLDKLSKISKEEVESQLMELGLTAMAIKGIMHAIMVNTFDDLEELLGSKSEPVLELKRLFELAEGYGYREWLVIDLTVLRGLSYYTGIVFEAFDSKFLFRAICGGGRYDNLVSHFGGPPIPACGFGFGDAVIMEVLNRNYLQLESSHMVDDIVFVVEEPLRPKACEIATKLRSAGRTVDLVMESKKLKWVFKHAEKLQAHRMILVGSKELDEGKVRVKDLDTGREMDVKLDDVAKDPDELDIPEPVTDEVLVEPRPVGARVKERDPHYLRPHEVKLVDAAGRLPEEYEVGFPSRLIIELFVDECRKSHQRYKANHYEDDPAPGRLKYLLRELKIEHVNLDQLSLREGKKLWAAHSNGIKADVAYAMVHTYKLPISKVVKLDAFEGEKRLAALRADPTPVVPGKPSYLDDPLDEDSE